MTDPAGEFYEGFNADMRREARKALEGSPIDVDVPLQQPDEPITRLRCYGKTLLLEAVAQGRSIVRVTSTRWKIG